MRILLSILALALLWPTVASAQQRVPRIHKAVTDNAGVLSDPAERKLANKLVTLREQTGVQMAILTVKSTGDLPIEDYGERFFEGQVLHLIGPQLSRQFEVCFAELLDHDHVRIALFCNK